ncbi:unnamed protein product [Callosobruchus maculatus]|uniref:Uncharacterized protein n=1 Tax=Callosobruchus maculatus TaxID=64391 RepID=A0A653DDK0_CALMS|nr:unnamed protein product [Callosobruchus maculatus]
MTRIYNIKEIIFAVVSISAFLCFWQAEAQNNLKVSLYYGSFQPLCKKFIKEQLYPTFQALQSYLDLEVVPFGMTKMTEKDGKYNFKCTFGPKECYTNEIHSCVVDIYPRMQAMEFLRCSAMEHDPSTDEVLQKCVANATISYEDIKKCHKTRGNQLLAANGLKSLKVGYKFVPAIVFNDTYDPKASVLGQTNMFVYVCTLLKTPPDICKSLREA